MNNKIMEIREIILEEIEPDKIYYYKTISLHIFVMIWDIEMSNSEKHIYVRRMLRTVDIPFDITVYSSRGFRSALKRNHLTADVVRFGEVIYEK